MPAKTYPLSICAKCKLPHSPVLGCQLAADLRGQLSGLLSRTIGDDEAAAEAYLWYDSEMDAHGVKTDHHGEFLKVKAQMELKKPAVHPAERLSAQIPAQKSAQKPREKPTSAQKVRKTAQKPDLAQNSAQNSAQNLKCAQCGNEWKPHAGKMNPQACPKCRSRRWK